MHPFIAKIPSVLVQQILSLTLYDMMRSSPGFEDVKEALNDRTEWSIELLRSCFSIHLTNDSQFFMLCTLSLLVMAETIQVRYGRLSPAELKECTKGIGYATFAILVAVLDIGCVVARITGLVALSGSPGLAASLVLTSMSPSVVLPLLTHAGKLAKRGRRGPGGGAEV